MFYLLIVYSLFFALLAWKNFRWAVFLFIIFLPTYLIRFELFHIGKYPFPSTLLEVTFGLLFLVWLVRYSREDWKKIVVVAKKHKLFFIAFDLFFLSSVVSIFVSDMVFFSLGEWRAFFLEPMILFLILIGRMSPPPFQGGVRGGLPPTLVNDQNLGNSLLLPLGKREITDGQRSPAYRQAGSSPDLVGITLDDSKHQINSKDLFLALIFSTLSITVYAIFQKFTGIGIATPQWTNEATRRVTAFFSSPNAVGLYVAPILILMAAVIWSRVTQLQSIVAKTKGLLRQPTAVGLLAMTGLAAFAIIFTKSQGTVIGLGAGMLTFLFFVGYKKFAVTVAIVGIIFSLAVPSMRQAVLFQDQANQNRLRLWGYSWTFLEQSPKNFVLGTGVRQFFRKVQKPYYDKYVMERLIYPHNIFLNFWTEIGLPGMLAVIAMLGYVFYLANKIRKNDMVIGAGLIAAITVLVVHGLVDVPYFKNDLAFLFWILMVSVLITYENFYKGQTELVRG